MAKNPYMPLYIGDYIKDTRILPLNVRGACVDLILYMWENDPKGELTGTIEDFSRLMGCSIPEAQECLFLLKEKKILSWGELPEENREGKERGMIRIISRKQKRMAALSESRQKSGKEGGNPRLGVNYNKEGYVYAMRRGTDGYIKIGTSTNPNKRIYKIREQQRTAEIFVIGSLFVADMATQEQYFHSLFQEKKVGDWFNLDENELVKLLFLLKEKNNSPLLSPQGKIKGNTEYENEYGKGKEENKGGRGEKGEEREGHSSASLPPTTPLPGAMLEAFVKAFPKYPMQEVKDYTACMQLGYQLSDLHGCSWEAANNGSLPEMLGKWNEIVGWIQTSSWFRTKSLSFLNDKFQDLIQAKNNGTGQQKSLRVVAPAGNGQDPTLIGTTGIGEI